MFSQRRRSANGPNKRNPERERHGARLRYCGARREEGKDKPALLVSCVSLFCRRSLLALCQPYGFFYRPQWRIDAQVLSPGSPCVHALASLRTSLFLFLHTRTFTYTTLARKSCNTFLFLIFGMRRGERFIVKARAKVGAYLFDKNEAISYNVCY